MTAATATVHPVDQVLPAGEMAAVGLQHVLVMYAGAIAVPLIVGGALKLPKDQLAFLINADLFACGVATLIQCLGLWKFGIRLPVIMGVTFAGGRADGGDGQQRRRDHRHLRRGHRRRRVHRAGRAVVRQARPLFPADRHRHDHRRHRHHVAARRRRLGRRRVRQQELRRAGVPRDRRAGARGDPRAEQAVEGLRREHRGADRARRRASSRRWPPAWSTSPASANRSGSPSSTRSASARRHSSWAR